MLVVEGALPSLEQALFQAGFGPRRQGAAKRVEEVLDPRGDAVFAGVVGTRTVVLGWALQELLADDDLSDEAAALHTIFGGLPFSVVGLHSAVGHYGYAVFGGGQCIRRRVGDAAGVHTDEGPRLEWEEDEGEASVFALLDLLLDAEGGFYELLDHELPRWHPFAEQRVKVAATVELEADHVVTVEEEPQPAKKKGLFGRLFRRS